MDTDVASNTVLAPPTSPYWITPCCGSLFGYQYDRWYPGGYACGVCSDNNKLAETFKSIFCIACKNPVKKGMYNIVKTYDDVYTHRYTRSVLFPPCVRYRRVLKQNKQPQNHKD